MLQIGTINDNLLIISLLGVLCYQQQRRDKLHQAFQEQHTQLDRLKLEEEELMSTLQSLHTEIQNLQDSIPVRPIAAYSAQQYIII